MAEPSTSKASLLKNEAITGKIELAGKPKQIFTGDSAAKTAGLENHANGGTEGAQTEAEFVLSLNCDIGSQGIALSQEETAESQPVQATRGKNTYVFDPVSLAQPRAKKGHVFRITSIRGNVAGFGGGSSMQVTATISL